MYNKVSIFFDMDAYKSIRFINGLRVCYYRFEVNKNLYLTKREIAEDDRVLHCICRTQKATGGGIGYTREVRYGYLNDPKHLNNKSKYLLIAVLTGIKKEMWTPERINSIANEWSYDEVHDEKQITYSNYKNLRRIF